MKGRLMTRKNYSKYADVGRTASVRSASNVVLQSLGIKGGGIQVNTYRFRQDNTGTYMSFYLYIMLLPAAPRIRVMM